MQPCPHCGASNPVGATGCSSCGRPFLGEEELFAQFFQKTPQRAIQGRYIVDKAILRGKVAILYRAQDVRSEEQRLLWEFSEIALLTGEEKNNARRAFREQAGFWESLRHPNLAPIADALTVGEKHYLVLDVPQVWALKQLVRSPSLPLEEEHVLSWGAQLAELLAHLHRQTPPIYLGEVQPEDFVVSREGLIQLVNYRLDRLFLPERDVDPRLAGKSPYVAPEVAGRSYTAASDIYGLGMLLYGVISRQVLDSSSHRPASLPNGIPGASRQFQAAILRATRREPGERFPSAAEMRVALWGNEPIYLTPLPAAKKSAPARAAASEARAPAARPASASAAVEAQAGPVESSRILIRPRRLEVEGVTMEQKRSAELAIYNMGEGELEGRLHSQVDWVVLGRTTFRLQPKQAVKVPVTVLGTRLPREGAVDPQAILVDSSAGRRWVSVQAKVVAEPILTLPQGLVDFGEVQGSRLVAARVPIRNSGSGMLSGVLRSRVEWLQVPRAEFVAAPGSDAQVEILLNPAILLPGAHRNDNALVVDSDAGQASIAAQVVLVKPILEVQPSYLDFGAIRRGERGQQTLVVTNAGDGLLDHSLRSQEPWLQVAAPPTRLPAGVRREIVVELDTSALPEGLTESRQALLVRSNGGAVTVPVRVRVLAPRLQIAQAELDFGEVPLGDPAQAVLAVRNSGSAPLHVRLESALAWLAPSRAELEIPAQGSADVVITAETTGFARGQYLELPVGLRVLSDGGEREIPARIWLLRPALEVEPAAIDFGIVDRAIPAERALTIRNRDTGLLEWQLSSEAWWVEIVPPQGVCPAGEEVQVRLVAYALALPPEQGSAAGMLRVASSGGERQLPLSLVVAAPRLDVDFSRVDLGVSVNYAEAEGSFLVFNRGLGPLRGEIALRSSRLTAEPAAFVCDTGMSQVIRVRANTTGLAAGLVSEEGAIAIRSNGGDAILDAFYEVVLQERVTAELPPLTLSEDQTQAQGKLAITNEGYEAVTATIQPSSPRLEITRRSCTVKPGKTLRLQVTLDRAAGGAEPLYFEIAAGKERWRVPVRMA